ncbi:hypothetical protein E2C01_016740 [Portunus trituberculatus]|uniref:Uncharacterized protein n=1 Tax=Portunus trituberculatus TaxID=210409 RepID=A0A5B7DRG6_PORTR|nr:hypothetical protein [Portunus trituberculatus]
MIQLDTQLARVEFIKVRGKGRYDSVKGESSWGSTTVEVASCKQGMGATACHFICFLNVSAMARDRNVPNDRMLASRCWS